MQPLSLGPLEQEIMRCVWRDNACTAREVTNCLAKQRQIAYNTVQTVMTRLVEKGVLKRELRGKTHIYRAKKRKSSTLRLVIDNFMSSFVSQFGEDALLAFADGLDDISDNTRQKLIKKLKQ